MLTLAMPMPQLMLSMLFWFRFVPPGSRERGLHLAEGARPSQPEPMAGRSGSRARHASARFARLACGLDCMKHYTPIRRRKGRCRKILRLKTSWKLHLIPGRGVGKIGRIIKSVFEVLLWQRKGSPHTRSPPSGLSFSLCYSECFRSYGASSFS